MQILFGPLRRLGGVNRTPGGGCLSVEFLWRRRCASHFVSLWPHRPALRVGLMATPRIVDAARQGRLDLVQGELHSGTNVDSRCPSSLSTALMAAATRGHMDIVQFLVANGASLNLVNKGGMTALDDARARGVVALAEGCND